MDVLMATGYHYDRMYVIVHRRLICRIC